MVVESPQTAGLCGTNIKNPLSFIARSRSSLFLQPGSWLARSSRSKAPEGVRVNHQESTLHDRSHTKKVKSEDGQSE